MTAATLDLERRAIFAAEALRAYRVALGGASLGRGAFEAALANVVQRQEEARAECSVLAAMIRDAGEHGAEQVERIATAVHLDTCSLADLDDYEGICRTIAAAARVRGEVTCG